MSDQALWHIDTRIPEAHVIEIWRTSGINHSQIARVWDFPSRTGAADAEFIVRACNSHADLLLALKHARQNLALCHARHGGTDWINRLALGVIDAAIVKAEGPHESDSTDPMTAAPQGTQANGGRTL